MTEPSEPRNPSLLETLDDLIFHISQTRTSFILLSLTSVVLAPIAIIVASFFVVHPGFLRQLLGREFVVGLLFTVYIGLTLILAVVWFVISFREYRFLARWNQRFRRFLSLKEQLDRELGEPTERKP